VRDLFNPLAATLTNDLMVNLNARVDVKGEDPADVAYSYLEEEGFIQ
jgi:osmoprotectant transport system substrate-binding protein